MKIWDTTKQIFSMPDLRNKIIFVAVLLFLARILAHVPIPGFDSEQLRSMLNNLLNKNQFFGLLNMFSGGAMQNFSIIMMGVGPYITASIIFQLLGMVIPAIDEINKEGESGRAKINYWTRLLTVPLSIIQGYAMINLLKSQGIITAIEPMQWVTMIIAMTAGTLLLMWLGELISEKGIGNGVSLLIALGIVSGIPKQIANTASLINAGNILGLLVFAAFAVLVIAGIIMANEGMRQIPVSYARRVRGLKSYGGVDTHLPIKVNSAGVIPIIFAMSMMIFPGVIAKVFQNARSEWLANGAQFAEKLFANNWFYASAYFVLVILFTYFYTGVIFKPEQMAENLQKQGGFIPGIRPGRETSEYLLKIISRITLSGAIFLGVIAVMPFVVQGVTKINTIALGGTGVLIMVSVIIETIRHIQAQLVMRSYDNY